MRCKRTGDLFALKRIRKDGMLKKITEIGFTPPRKPILRRYSNILLPALLRNAFLVSVFICESTVWKIFHIFDYFFFGTDVVDLFA